jgi:hypothetical protein
MEPAFATSSTFSGTYRIEGEGNSGIAEVIPNGLFAHIRANLDPIGTRFGLAVLFDQRLLIACGPEKKVEIGAYRITGDRMHGIWIPPDAAGDDLSACGQEQSVRVDSQTWKIQQAHDLEKKSYTGSITVRPIGTSSPDEPQMVRILWKLHDGDYNSFGLLGDDWMVSTFNFAAGTDHAIAAYEKSSDGWSGVQLWNDYEALRRERLIRQ